MASDVPVGVLQAHVPTEREVVPGDCFMGVNPSHGNDLRHLSGPTPMPIAGGKADSDTAQTHRFDDCGLQRDEKIRQWWILYAVSPAVCHDGGM